MDGRTIGISDFLLSANGDATGTLFTVTVPVYTHVKEVE